jgi:superoxide dismutase, Fe-Mn family
MTGTVDRRTALTSLGAAAALAAGGCQSVSPTAWRHHEMSALQPLPLPFDPKSIPGFSEAILISHHANNYTGAVKRIGAIEAELARLPFDTAPGFQINGLQREALLAMNSAILHEAHFRSIGPSENRRPSAALARQIEQDFGSYTAWYKTFSALGKALGGGSGWVLLSWSPRLGRLVNQWAADHTMTLADGHVLIALDMYEHAYHMDFGAKAGAYVDAFMTVLDWRAADTAFASSSIAS